MTSERNDRMRFATALRSFEFWLLLIGAVIAGCGGSIWIVVPLVMAGLFFISHGRQEERDNTGADVRPWIALLSSLIISFAGAVAAFVVGKLTWWVWGI